MFKETLIIIIIVLIIIIGDIGIQNYITKTSDELALQLEELKQKLETLEDGKTYDGTVMWSDTSLDLSITKIEAKNLSCSITMKAMPISLTTRTNSIMYSRTTSEENSWIWRTIPTKRYSNIFLQRIESLPR